MSTVTGTSPGWVGTIFENINPAVYLTVRLGSNERKLPYERPRLPAKTFTSTPGRPLWDHRLLVVFRAWPPVVWETQIVRPRKGGVQRARDTCERFLNESAGRVSAPGRWFCGDR